MCIVPLCSGLIFYTLIIILTNIAVAFMKYYFFSFILLLMTTPISSDYILFGIPLWAIISLLVTVLYALSLIIIIDKKWHKFL